MRPLATSGYTDTQIAAALDAPQRSYGARAEILDRDGRVIADLTDFDVAVDVNVDADVHGSIDLRLRPDETLRGELFTRQVKVYVQLGMPDGGTAEWPAGIYLWHTPARDVDAAGVEWWRGRLPDRTYLLTAAGPGPRGFTAYEGERVTDVMRRALTEAGITDTTGIADSPHELGRNEAKTWCLIMRRTRRRKDRLFAEAVVRHLEGQLRSTTDPFWRGVIIYELNRWRRYRRDTIRRAPDVDTQQVTWHAILADLAAATGHVIFADLADGRIRIEPYRPAASTSPDLTITPSRGSLLRYRTDPRIDTLHNRTFVRATNVNDFAAVEAADANTIVPDHPAAQRQIGFYKDAPVIDDPVATDRTALATRARVELVEALQRYDVAAVETLMWPTHDPYDLIGLTLPDDPDLATGSTWHQRGYTLEPRTGRMRRSLSRLYDLAGDD